MRKTLREYIEFLQEHNFFREANMYRNQVVEIVSVATGFTPEQVLDMPTKSVIEALIRAKDTLESVRVPEKYDVELVG